MESQTWRITPCQYIEIIEGKEIFMLGYELEEREDDRWTKFKMCNIPRKYYSIIHQALLDFFYPENILFGNKLYETENYSIYERSDIRIPGSEYTTNFKGVLYCNFLARGRLPFDLILLERKDMRKKDTRKREVLEEEEVKEVLYNLFEKFDSQASYIMLEKMEQYWCSIPEKMVDLETWYYAICQLVRNVSKDEELVKKFERKYSDLVYVERKTTDGIRNQLIEQTKQWYQKEQAYIRLLFETIDSIFPYKLYDEEPDVVIQKEDKKNWGPLIFAKRRYCRSRKDK